MLLSRPSLFSCWSTRSVFRKTICVLCLARLHLVHLRSHHQPGDFEGAVHIAAMAHYEAQARFHLARNAASVRVLLEFFGARLWPWLRLADSRTNRAAEQLHRDVQALAHTVLRACVDRFLPQRAADAPQVRAFFCCSRPRRRIHYAWLQRALIDRLPRQRPPPPITTPQPTRDSPAAHN